MQPLEQNTRLNYELFKTTIIMKYQYTFVLTLLLSFFISNNTFSQNSTEEMRVEYQKLTEELKGYVQIQMINTRSNPTIGLDLLQQIKIVHERISTEEFIQVSPYLRIRVLPKNALLIKDAETIVYISE